MIDPERIRNLNKMEEARGEFVLYWMQASQRTLHNHALEFAIEKADLLGLPVVVFFGIAEDYPEANERHYQFMLEGLRVVRAALAERGIQFVIHA